jgi:uncharacterized protein (DUF433 family)
MVERGLDSEEIAALYPGLTVVAIDDALGLERQLRRVA